MVYTPSKIASAIAAKAISLGYGNGLILEPSIGDGAFLDALAAHGVDAGVVTAVDVDSVVLRGLGERFPTASFHEGDFVGFALAQKERRYRLVIGNPPYIRRANFHPNFSNALDALSEQASYVRGHLKNAWAAFVVAAEAVLDASDAMLVFVVPYELLNVDYGVAIQKFLAEKFQRVDIVVSESKAFPSLDQDAVVFLAQRVSEDRGVFIHHVPDFESLDLRSGRVVDYDKVNQIALSLKSFLLEPDLMNWLSDLRETSKTIGDFFNSHTGTVTAANQYFILTKSDVERFGLSEWARPILKKGSYVSEGPIFDESDFQKVAEKYPSFVLDFGSVTDPLPDNVQEYLDIGIAEGVDQSYKARHREVWYHVPVAKTSSAFFFKRSHSYPRIILNRANSLVTDTAYVINPIGDNSVEALCYSFYNSLTLLFSEIEGRFYGGGVLELTPKEFRRIPLFYSEPSAKEFKAFADGSTWRNPESLASHGDQVLAQKHGFSNDDLARARKAWLTLRGHRLRHGARTAGRT